MKSIPLDDVAGIRSELDVTEGAPVAICTSELVPSASIVSLVVAWRRIADIWPHATLFLMGDGPSRPAVQAAIERLDLRSEVRLAGGCVDPGRLFRIADLHVIAADSPGVAAAVAVASAAAKPTVAPDDWAHRVFVKDGETGALFMPGDVQCMAAAIASLLQDPFTAERMGRAAQARYLREGAPSFPAEMESAP